VRRWLFNLAAAVSLVLCVASAACWALSYVTTTDVTLRKPHDDSLAGQISISSGRGTLSCRQRPDKEEWGAEFDIRFAGFTMYGGRDLPLGAGTAIYWHVWAVPYWFLIALTSVLPFIWAGKRLRRRHRSGLCPTCGYDLRATPDRCPECGAVLRVSRVPRVPPVPPVPRGGSAG
jgi:hypothetical protein